MKKTALIIDFYDRNDKNGEFTDAFYNALDEMFNPRKNGITRVNGYQRVYIRPEEERDEELLPDWKLVEDTLIEKGYTHKDLILVNNTW
jgi:hypothetical protein